MKKDEVDENLLNDCKRLGYATLSTWFSDHDIVLTKSENFLESIRLSVKDEVISPEQLNEAVAELDENSDKKIFLLQLSQFDFFAQSKTKILKDLHLKHSIVASDKKWVNSNITSTTPKFINLFWDENIVKIKFSEIHYVIEPDYENNTMIKAAKKVNILYLLNLNDGLVQIRFDKAGTVHSHKNDQRKSTEGAYESYYKELLLKLFPDFEFKNLNLSGVANHIATIEKTKFRITKGVTTISNNAKQTFASASTKADVRNLPEYEAAASGGTELWLAEDIVGYWIADASEKQLERDLFMRIYRRDSQVRVQRGCLEKELNYGIDKIREIQTTV